MHNKSFLLPDAGVACVILLRWLSQAPNQTRPATPLFAKYTTTVVPITVTE